MGIGTALILGGCGVLAAVILVIPMCMVGKKVDEILRKHDKEQEES